MSILPTEILKKANIKKAIQIAIPLDGGDVFEVKFKVPHSWREARMMAERAQEYASKGGTDADMMAIANYLGDACLGVRVVPSGSDADSVPWESPWQVSEWETVAKEGSPFFSTVVSLLMQEVVVRAHVREVEEVGEEKKDYETPPSS